MFSILLLFLNDLAAAASVPAGHHYKAPGRGDVRSPCPGLNTLANHGFLPRNGQGLTVATLIQGLQAGMNVGADFASSVGALGLMSSPNPFSTTFNLNNLDEHNFPIEHDGSLSRLDYYEGNDYSFNQKVFNEVLAFYENTTTATIPVASKARYARIQAARAINPTFIYGIRQLVLSYGETALYLSVMGDPITGEAPLTYVKSLFGMFHAACGSLWGSELTQSFPEKEEFPYAEGWQKPSTETTLATLGLMITRLQVANPDAVAEGLTLGEGTYRDVIELINPLTGKAENVTCILAGTC